MGSTFLKKYLQKTSSEKQSTAAIAFLAGLDHISEKNPAVSQTILHELQDQRSHLKLIASENYSSLAVQLAMGNLFTDKYAEGYAHHRFYAGCENVDSIEDLAQKELIKLFGCQHASVQPHSGADANLMAFWAILCQRVQTKEVEKLGKKTLEELSPDEYEKVRQLLCSQKILGLSLNSGGHLTHGYKHNISSKMMQAFSYDVEKQTFELNYNTILTTAREVRPLILLAGYSAYTRLINFRKMREIADEVGAVFMVDMAHFSGLVAGKVFIGDYNPVQWAHIVTSTTHKTLRGPRGGIVLCTEEFSEMINKGCPLVMGGPLPHVIAAKAVAFKEANTQEFIDYAHKIVKNSQALAEALKKEGITLLTGGTDNHMVILDVTSLGLNGRQAEKALRDAHLTVNRNSIPDDKNGPWYTSGIRIGTPAMTTLGMGESEMAQIAKTIAAILKNTKPTLVTKTGELSKANYQIDQKTLERAKSTVHELLQQYPLYPEILLDCELALTQV